MTTAVTAAAVPWPFGRPPSATHLRALRGDAVRLFTNGRGDEHKATVGRNEDVESLQIDQAILDRGELPAETLFLFGDEFFETAFRPFGGYGGVVPGPNLRRVHQGRKGGLDTHACAGCHSLAGPDGAGSYAENAFVLGDGERASSANVRNPPSLLGGGLVQAIGVEMSAALRKQRDEAIERAKERGAPATVELEVKGVRFGTLVANPDGSVDPSRVVGVDHDLIVRPFGWKGDNDRLRRMVEEAARIHFGAQAHVLAVRHRDTPDAALGAGPNWYDPDGDGVEREIEEGTVSATALYLAMLEVPVIVPPNQPRLLERWAEGDALFTRIGCDTCHVRELHLDERFWVEHADTTGGSVRINLLADGEQPRGNDQVRLFSDLKRHDMGPGLADRVAHPSGIGKSVFLTRPLWGLAETAPYLHDGRAGTIPEAILAHGGEAREATLAFAALSQAEQASLHVFLLSLTREPKLRFPR